MTGGATALLVRTTIVNDGTPDNGETFTLTATPTGGTAATGTATIKDDGTGDIFKTDGTTDPNASKNNDITVSSPTVNEASPYAVFTVTVTSGQNLSLALSNGTAVGGTTSPTDGTVDYGSTALEYSLDNGGTWTTYSGAFNATLTGGATALLVRTTIVNDGTPDNGETFTLTATPTGGTAATGTATIKDDGTGDIFKTDGTTNTTATKNDDRPLTIANVEVNEGAPYAVFVVSGAAGQLATLSLAAGTATGGGTDFGSASGTGLEYWDGSTWQTYTAGANVALNANGKLLVRTAITNDTVADNGETFELRATNTGGTTASGTGTIKDDGTGTIFTATPTGDTPGTDGSTVKNDDRPLSIANVEVNEGSP